MEEIINVSSAQKVRSDSRIFRLWFVQLELLSKWHRVSQIEKLAKRSAQEEVAFVAEVV